jgi:hypothetical protein
MPPLRQTSIGGMFSGAFKNELYSSSSFPCHFIALISFFFDTCNPFSITF